MESQDESIDIESIKRAALSTFDPMPRSESRQNVSKHDRVEAIKRAFQASVITGATQSQNTDGASIGEVQSPRQQLENSNSLPELASTVPDSQGIFNVEPSLPKFSRTVVVKGPTPAKKMSSQASLPQDTQPISQSIYEDIISKAKGASDDKEKSQHSGAVGATQRTLNEGDDGHIDLLSSFQHGAEDNNGGAEDAPDSDPVDVDFSPTQTQHHLPQFPESQRFKTPATISKKRNYLGDPVETPTLPWNPLARSGDPTPGRLLGLSQAFAATQAASSPLLNGIPSEPPSDRPSPKIDLQTRPATASLSSPLRPISDVRRTVTEPYTKYTSIKESQAEREKQAGLRLLAAQESHPTGSDDDDDDFGAEPSIVERRRRQKKRDEEVRQQFEAISTAARPRSRGQMGSLSSPSKGPKLSSPRTYSRKRGHFYNNSRDKDNNGEGIAEGLQNGSMSEEETEKEDEADIAVRRSSQTSIPAEEDKENVNHEGMQIPETTARLQHAINAPSQVEASPSIRHLANGMIRVQQALDVSPAMNSSPTFAVANSQPSQPSHTNRQQSMRTPPALDEGRSFVPQSQYVTNETRGGPTEGTETSAAVQVQFDAADSHDLTTQSCDGVGVGCDHGAPGDRTNIRRGATSAAMERPDNAQLGRTGGNQVSNGFAMSEAMGLATQARRQPSRIASAQESTIPETSPSAQHGQIEQPNIMTNATAISNPSNSKSSTNYETAQTHPPKSSDSPLRLHPQPPSSILASPSGRKRRRMAEIAADLSPDDFNAGGGFDMDAVMAIVQDKEFQNVIGGSSPIAPGRNTKRRRLIDRFESVHTSSPPQKARGVNRTGSAQLGMADAQKNSSAHDEPRMIEQGNGSGALSSDHVSPNITHSASTVLVEHISAPQTKRKGHRSSRRSEALWDIHVSTPNTAVAKPRALKAISQKLPEAIPPRKASSHLARPTRLDFVVDTTSEDGSTEANARQASLEILSSNFTAPPAGEVIYPYQVFACFNGKTRVYYPATCVGVAGAESLRYQVQWEGFEEPDEIDAHGVRSLDLRVGDAVKIELEGYPKVSHIIRGFKDRVDPSAKESKVLTDVHGYKTLLVAAKQSKTLHGSLASNDFGLKEVPVSAIYLDSNMWNQMKDREFLYNARASTTAAPPQPGFLTPSERPSTPSTPSSRPRRMTVPPAPTEPLPLATSGIFANMAFAISYAALARKASLTSLIRSNGGTVLTDGFHELFTKWDDNEDLQLKPVFAGLGFTALLADRHSRKTKYMEALALNLPCLSGRWIQQCVERGDVLNWSQYLLPAGESQALDGAVRSRTLPDSNAKVAQLQSILATRFEMLKAHGKRVIMVLGRGKSEAKRRPYLFLIKALGAGRIEKVVDLKDMKSTLQEQVNADGAEYGYVFVDDKDVDVSKSMLAKMSKKIKDHTKVVGNEALCQSLILGSLYDGR